MSNVKCRSKKESERYEHNALKINERKHVNVVPGNHNET